MTDAPDMASPDFIRTFPNRTSDFIAQQAADLKAMTAERDALASRVDEFEAQERKSRGYRVGHIAGFHAGIRQAAQEALNENERRLALASIRIPAMASEINKAILALIDTGDTA